MLVEKRETRYRVQWYYKLFEQTMRGLNRDHRTGAMPNADSIHGSLLALGELLQHTGEFLLARCVCVGGEGEGDRGDLLRWREPGIVAAVGEGEAPPPDPALRAPSPRTS